ncbi:fructosamine kinase family protein [Granulicoccus sp. GXG6511]|uniref:fructosamine kinase family protein n=1 Tax=Granulicoccus sp. GXG6511 TaxID=3381351 RepID=UPI003D7C5DB7
MEFTKRDHSAPPGFFAVEAAGLRWLADAGGARVVRVLDAGEHHLTLERLTPSRPTAEDAARFGRDLARTHAAGAPGWGAPPPGTGPQAYIGPLPQTNRTEPTWGAFYARHRVRPFADRARDEGSLDARSHTVIEALCQRLEAGEFDDDRVPARIHGDLWSGNVLTTTGTWTLIDPAAHGGHPFTDLAMLALFGLAHLGAVLDGYADTAPLEPGWQALIPLHQLHPLLVHAVLFGSGYGTQAAHAAAQY